MAIILGIESTAHTFGVGIVKDGKILSNVRQMYSTEKGGIIPIESAKHHEKVAEGIYYKALAEAGINEAEIEGIAFSQGPGLSPCLLVGLRKMKEWAEKLKVPVVPVNHCIAHLEIGRVTGAKDPVLLYASGANTQIIAYESGKYRIFGETLDLGVGNFIDTFARYMDLGFPGGPKVEELARKSKAENYIELPYTVKGMDIALSGLLTNLKQKIEKGFNKEDLCFSMQETVFPMLVEVSERALAHIGKKELVLGGGVACNSRLQEMCKIMCEERGVKCFIPSKDLLTDNAAMIAYTGELIFNNGDFVENKDVAKIDIKPRQRTDEVQIKYR